MFDLTITDCFISIPLILILTPRKLETPDIKINNISINYYYLPLLVLSFYFFVYSLSISNYYSLIEIIKKNITYTKEGSIKIKPRFSGGGNNAFNAAMPSLLLK